jgi:hypothetical protein
MKLGRGKASLRFGEARIYNRFETPMIKKNNCGKRDNLKTFIRMVTL